MYDSTGMPSRLVSLTYRASALSILGNSPVLGRTVFRIFFVPEAFLRSCSLNNIDDKDFRANVLRRNFFITYRQVSEIFSSSLHLSIICSFSLTVNLLVIDVPILLGTAAASGICSVGTVLWLTIEGLYEGGGGDRGGAESLDETARASLPIRLALPGFKTLSPARSCI